MPKIQLKASIKNEWYIPNTMPRTFHLFLVNTLLKDPQKQWWKHDTMFKIYSITFLVVFDKYTSINAPKANIIFPYAWVLSTLPSNDLYLSNVHKNKTKNSLSPMIQMFFTRHITSECSNLLIVTKNKLKYWENLHDNQLTQRIILGFWVQ